MGRDTTDEHQGESHVRSTTVFLTVASVFALLTSLSMFGCDDDDDEGENTGAACDEPSDCYPGVDPEDLRGDIECLDRVEGGYCTHLCTADEDCCAVDGECETGIPQVCAPFESLPEHRCFLSCEQDVIGDMDATAYCQEHAHSSFGCRSTGGGAENRRVCLP